MKELLQFGLLSEIEGSVMNRVAKHLLTLLFIGLVVLYAALLWWNAGGSP